MSEGDGEIIGGGKEVTVKKKGNEESQKKRELERKRGRRKEGTRERVLNAGWGERKKRKGREKSEGFRRIPEWTDAREERRGGLSPTQKKSNEATQHFVETLTTNEPPTDMSECPAAYNFLSWSEVKRRNIMNIITS